MSEESPWPPPKIGVLRLSEYSTEKEYIYFDPRTGDRWWVTPQQLAMWGLKLRAEAIRTYGRMQSYEGISPSETLVKYIQMELLVPEDTRETDR